MSYKIFNPEEYKEGVFEYNTKETNELRVRFREKKEINIEDLRRIALWKIDRVLDIPEETIEGLNRVIKKEGLKYKDSELEKIIEKLYSCQGIGFPMLSAFLKFLRPEIFPIIDIRAYRAIYGKKIGYTQYTKKIYFDYIEEVYKIRDKLNIPLYKVDEQLYLFDKRNNGKI